MTLNQVILTFISFVAFSWPLTFVGRTQSSAYDRLALLGDAPLDIAVIGDSRAHTGISPTVLARTLDATARNKIVARGFAVDGTDAVHHASFAKNGLLYRKGHPSLIIWAVNPLQFSSTRDNNRLEQLRGTDIFWLFNARAPHELLLNLITMHLFAPWGHKPALMSAFSDYAERAAIRSIPFQTKILGLHYEKEPVSRKYTQHSDGQESFVIYDWQRRFERGAETYRTDDSQFQLGHWHIDAARLILSDARKAGVKVVIVKLPVSNWYRHNILNNTKHTIWRKMMAEVAASEGAIFLNHAESLPGDDRLFGDPGHMPEAMAAQYSANLARELLRLGIWSNKP